MFSKSIKGFISSSLVFLTASCGMNNHNQSVSSTKSVVDKSNRVFGFQQTGVDSTGNNQTFEFRLCRQKTLPTSAINDPNVCINPYLQNGKPLVVTMEAYKSFQDLETTMMVRGYAKSVAIAAPVTVGLIYGGVVGFYALAFSGGISNTSITAFVLSSLFANHVQAVAEAAVVGEAIGLQFWGRADREGSRDIDAVLGDFYSAKDVPDTTAVVKMLGYQAGIELNPQVESF